MKSETLEAIKIVINNEIKTAQLENVDVRIKTSYIAGLKKSLEIMEFYGEFYEEEGRK